MDKKTTNNKPNEDLALEDAWKNQKKKKYDITLSPNIKDETIKLLKINGGKLSPLVDSLLLSWIYRQRLVKDIMNGVVINDKY